jgi:N-acetylglutamate synthase-like GNAT family acetyltransferase
MNNLLDIAKADSKDIDGIVSILLMNRMETSLFLRSRRSIEKNLNNFIVAKDKLGQVLGCAELRIHSRNHAEIVSLAVGPESQRKGLGRSLVTYCTQLAQSSGIRHLWASTLKPAYFLSMGFRETSMWGMPLHVLLRKLCEVFKQPRDRWLLSLSGKYYFLIKSMQS